MNCEKIEAAINKLNITNGRFGKGKGKVIDEIHIMHLNAIDSILMDIRVKIRTLGDNEQLRKVDEIIYKTINP